MSKINKSPVLTSQNYGINYFDLDDDLLYLNKKSDFKLDIKNQNADKIIIEEISQNDSFLNNLSEKLNKIAKKQANFAKKVTISQNFSEPLIFQFEIFQDSFLCGNLIFDIKENVNAKIIIKNDLSVSSAQLSTIKVVAQQNSNVDIILLNSSQNANANLISFETEQKENSKINLHIIEFSSKNSVQNVKFNLLGDSSNAVLDALYLAEDKNELSLNYSVNMSGKCCQSKIQSLGLMWGESQKNFVGTINFERGSSKSRGEENELCFVFSDKARAKSTPILLSKEDDAVGTHSSSVQNIDPKKMFYANTRGLSSKEATKIFVNAKINMFLKNVFDEETKSQIISLIDRRFEDEKLQ